MRPHLPDAHIPIPIAVRGHGRPVPEALAALRATATAVLSNLRAQYANSPVWLLTSLAEGGDRVVAEIALGLDMPLIAVLPLPVEAYRRSFDDDSSRDEFDRLLGLATHVEVLPELDPDSLAADPRRVFVQLADNLARRSLLLLALWDGEESQERGDTASNVDKELSGLHGREDEGEQLQDDPVGGTVCQIVTPRVGGTNPGFPAGHCRWLVKDGDAVVEIASGPAVPRSGASQDVLRRLNHVNGQLVDSDEDLVDGVAQARDWFLGAEDREGLPPGVACMLRHYAAADALATKYQTLRLDLLFRLSVYALAAIFALSIYNEAFDDDDPWGLLVLLVYPVGLLAGISRYRFARSRGWDSLQIDYRALAEGLRVQIAWWIAGVDDDVTDHYLHTLRGEFQWVRGAIRACSVSAIRSGAHLRDGSLDLVRRRWIRDQLKYFQRSVHNKQDQAKRYERLVQVMVGVSFVISVLVGPVRYFGLDPMIGGSILEALSLSAGMELLVAVSVAAAATIAAWSERMGLLEIARQHDRMYLVFSRAEERINVFEEGGRLDSARGVVRELGLEALTENATWVLLHRARPVEAPGLE